MFYDKIYYFQRERNSSQGFSRKFKFTHKIQYNRFHSINQVKVEGYVALGVKFEKRMARNLHTIQ